VGEEQQKQYIRGRQVTETDLKYTSEELSHLSLEQVQNLVTRYYNGERASALIKEYEIDCPPTKLYELFPPVVMEDKTCEYCNGPIVCIRFSKSNVQIYKKTSGRYFSDPICNSCNHKLIDSCDCPLCKEKHEQEIKRQREEKIQLIREVYDIDNLQPVPFENLNVRDRLYLAALMRMGLDINMEKTEPAIKWADKLTPSSDYDSKILNYLFDRDIIKVHPSNSIDVFSEKEDREFPYVFYTFRVGYHINVDIFMIDRRNSIEMLSNPTINEFIPSNVALLDLVDIWMEIAVAEAKEYLQAKLEDVNLINGKLPVGDHIESIFKEILKDFPTSKLFNFIFRAVKDGLHFKAEKGIRNPEIIVKFIVGKCRSISEKVLAENWNVSPFRRDYKIPQSVLSELLYNKVLRIGQKGFDMTPNLDGLMQVVEILSNTSAPNSLDEEDQSHQEVAASKEEE
jgi:hypothetical protein